MLYSNLRIVLPHQPTTGKHKAAHKSQRRQRAQGVRPATNFTNSPSFFVIVLWFSPTSSIDACRTNTFTGVQSSCRTARAPLAPLVLTAPAVKIPTAPTTNKKQNLYESGKQRPQTYWYRNNTAAPAQVGSAWDVQHRTSVPSAAWPMLNGPHGKMQSLPPSPRLRLPPAGYLSTDMNTPHPQSPTFPRGLPHRHRTLLPTFCHPSHLRLVDCKLCSAALVQSLCCRDSFRPCQLELTPRFLRRSPVVRRLQPGMRMQWCICPLPRLQRSHA